MILIAFLYGLTASLLALYGLNALFLTALFFRHRAAAPALRPVDESGLPTVTVQLPIYNEKYVATRLIDAVCALEYPRERLQIQVLDDSTDETVRLVARRVRGWQRRGLSIVQVRRPERQEYKAGALAYGLPLASGELIAVFDADFVPGPDWLRRTVAHFCQPGSERLGLVQTRWSHLNADYSPLTRAQALMLDGHFAVEQLARARGGLLFNFNGTAGLWRRGCIEEAGGWSGSTLCEDLDLSYRAQLSGWTLRYDPTIHAPAELPAQVASYKRQQFRWAKGSIQVARRLGAEVLGSSLSLGQKLQGVLHLTGYAVHPLLVLLLLLTPLLLWWGWPAAVADYQSLLSWTVVAGLGAPLLYAVAQRALHGEAWGRRCRFLPLLILLGVGIALNNSRAVLEGILGRPGGEFRRTPKFRLEGQSGSWEGSCYTLRSEGMTVGELLLSLYALFCCLVAVVQEQWVALPFLALYALAFGWVGGLSLWQGYTSARPRHAQATGA